MHIVSLHAHPDDAEILAGGTLALLSKLGHGVTIVTMTAGDCGSSTIGRSELSVIRRNEASTSAALIGAAYRWAGFDDLSIFSDDTSRRKVTAVLRELAPDIVLTASPSDYMSDHEATSQLVRDACFAASVPNYSVPGSAAPLQAIPHLYFLDPIDALDREGRLLHSDFVVDVASSFQTKRAMLGEHRSQRAWLSQQHGMPDYLLQMEQWTRACGERAGLSFGEGFRQYKVHPYPQSPALQGILADYLAVHV